MNIKKAWRDLKLVVANSPLIPLINFPVTLETYSEFKHLDKLLFPRSAEVPNPVGRQYVHADRWFYANGVMSDRYMWALTAEYISTLFDKKIEALFNPTATLAIDIVESVLGRTFGRLTETVKGYYAVLKPVLESGAEVHVIAHSQGGISMAETIRKLIQNGVDVSKLHVYTFGSGHDGFDFPSVYSEHFANRFDYVARLGVLTFGAGRSPVYKTDHFGHLLNAHYLPNFIEGDYCGGKSKLYSYLIDKP